MSNRGSLKEAVKQVDHLIDNPKIRALLHYMAGQYDVITSARDQAEQQLEQLQQQTQSNQRQLQQLHKSSKKAKDESKIYRALLRQNNIQLPSDNTGLEVSSGGSGSDSEGNNRADNFDTNFSQPRQLTSQPLIHDPLTNEHNDGRRPGERHQRRQEQPRREGEIRPIPQRQQQLHPLQPSQQSDGSRRNLTAPTPGKPQTTAKPKQNRQRGKNFSLLSSSDHDLSPLPPLNLTTSGEKPISRDPIAYSSILNDRFDTVTYSHRVLQDKYNALPLPPFYRHQQFISRMSQFIIDLYHTATRLGPNLGMNDSSSNEDDDEQESHTIPTDFSTLQHHHDKKSSPSSPSRILDSNLIPHSLAADFEWLVVSAKAFYNSYTFLCTIPLLLTPVISVLPTPDQQSLHQSNKSTVIAPTDEQENQYWSQIREVYYLIMAITLLICDAHADKTRLDDFELLDNDGHGEYLGESEEEEDEDAEESVSEEGSGSDDELEHQLKHKPGDGEEGNSKKRAKKPTLTKTQLLRKSSIDHDTTPVGISQREISEILRSDLPIKALFDYHPFERYFTDVEHNYISHTRRLLNVIDSQHGSALTAAQGQQSNSRQLDNWYSSQTPIPTSIAHILNPTNFLLTKNALVSIMFTIEGDQDSWWYHFFTLLSTPLTTAEYRSKNRKDLDNDNESTPSVSPTQPILSTPNATQNTMSILSFWFLASQSFMLQLLNPSPTQQSHSKPQEPTFIITKHSSQLNNVNNIINTMNGTHSAKSESSKPNNPRHQQIATYYSEMTKGHFIPPTRAQSLAIVRELALIQFSTLLNSLVYSYSHQTLEQFSRPIDLALMSTNATLNQRANNDGHLHTACMFQFNVQSSAPVGSSPVPLQRETKNRKREGNSDQENKSTHEPILPLSFQTPIYQPLIARSASQSDLNSDLGANRTIAPIYIANSLPRANPGPSLQLQELLAQYPSPTYEEAMANVSTLIPTSCQCCTFHLAVSILTSPHNTVQEHPVDNTIPPPHPLFKHYHDLEYLNRTSLAYKQSLILKVLSMASFPYYTHDQLQYDKIFPGQQHFDPKLSWSPLDSNRQHTNTPPAPFDPVMMFEALVTTQLLAQHLVSTVTWFQSYMLLKHTLLPWYSSIIYSIHNANLSQTRCDITTQQFVMSTMQFLFLIYSLIPSLYHFVSYGPTTPLPLAQTQHQNQDQKLPFTTTQVTLVFSLLAQIEIFLDILTMAIRSPNRTSTIIQYDQESNSDSMGDNDHEHFITPLHPLVTTATSTSPQSSSKSSSLLPDLQVEAIYHLRRYIAVLNQTYIGSSEQYRPQAPNSDSTPAASTIVQSHNTVPTISLDPQESTPSITFSKLFVQQCNVLNEFSELVQRSVLQQCSSHYLDEENNIDPQRDEEPFAINWAYDMHFDRINDYLRSKLKHDEYITWRANQDQQIAQRKADIATKRSANLSKARSLRHPSGAGPNPTGDLGDRTVLRRPAPELPVRPTTTENTHSRAATANVSRATTANNNTSRTTISKTQPTKPPTKK